MALAVVAFLITVTAIIGGYYAVTYLPGRLSSRTLDRRLQEVSSEPFGTIPDMADATVVKRAEEGPLPALDRLMSRGRAGSLSRIPRFPSDRPWNSATSCSRSCSRWAF